MKSELLVRNAFCLSVPGVCDPPLGLDDADLIVALPFEFSHRKRNQRAIFANFNYAWDNLKFGFGLRLDRWQSERTNLDTGMKGSKKETEVLGRASLSWTSDSGQNMLYGTVSQGYEPGDLNLGSFSGSSNLFGYGSEEATQYELGYKGRLMEDRLVLILQAKHPPI